MSFYQRIIPLQEPFDEGLDDKARSKLTFNILSKKTPSDTFLEEIAKRLEDQGVGTRNVNIFVTSIASLPSGVGPYLSIVETGGTGPLKEQISNSPSWQRPGAKIVVRASDYVAARTMTRAAYDALANVVNMNLVG